MKKNGNRTRNIKRVNFGVLVFLGPQRPAPVPRPRPHLLFYGSRSKWLFRCPHISKWLFTSLNYQNYYFTVLLVENISCICVLSKFQAFQLKEDKICNQSHDEVQYFLIKRKCSKLNGVLKNFSHKSCEIKNRSERKIVYKKTAEWYIEWQRVAANGTSSDKKWQRVVHRVTTNDNEWQRMTTTGTTNDNEW